MDQYRYEENVYIDTDPIIGGSLTVAAWILQNSLFKTFLVGLCGISGVILQQRKRLLQFPSGRGTRGCTDWCMIVKFYVKSLLIVHRKLTYKPAM